MSQGQHMAAKRAWNYFEEVEAKDAATRVRVGLAGGAIPATNLWCQFNGDGMRALYEKGRRYHILICPEYDWTPQRNRGIPSVPLDTVLPDECPCFDCSGETLPRTAPPPPEARALATQPKTRSNQLIREGIPTNPRDSRFETITLVSNTPQSPLSVGTPASPNPPGTPTSVGSPHPPGSPASVKEPAPILEVSEIRLTPVPAADTIQLV